MNETNPNTDDRLFAHRALEAAIRIGLVFLLVRWCFSITRPFLMPAVWGVIIAIGVDPLFRRF